MLAFLRRRRTVKLSGVSFSDSRGEVCTSDCRAAALQDRVRTAALANVRFR